MKKKILYGLILLAITLLTITSLSLYKSNTIKYLPLIVETTKSESHTLIAPPPFEQTAPNAQEK